VASALLGGATVAGVMLWAHVAFSPRAGFWAGLVAAIYPGLVALGGVVLSEALFMPLMVLQLVLWTLAWQARREAIATHSRVGSDLAWSACAGAAAGLATLVRPSWLLFTPLALAVELAWGLRADVEPRAWPRRIAAAAIMLGSLAAVMMPWWIRNALVTGHFVPTTLQVGASLYDGLNPAADGGSNMAFVAPFTAAFAREQTFDPAAKREDFEYQLDARLRADAWRWAAEHQGRVVQLALIKLGRVWNIWPNEPAFRSWPVRLAVVGSYAPVALAGALGAWRLRAAGWVSALCWLPAAYVSIMHMIFVGSIRYREPAMLGLIVLAAALLTGPEGKERSE
jgi:4-amino-4-deoxy-L-arabinose transferase-like glycosyltransferase